MRGSRSTDGHRPRGLRGRGDATGTVRTTRTVRPTRTAAPALCGLAILLGVSVAPSVATSPPAGAAMSDSGSSSGTVWLCRPGQADDPCSGSAAATDVSSNGTTSPVAPISAPQAGSFDCFYVYPTSSREPGDNADLTVQPAEREVAAAQASPFSQVCHVWAPMYRQATERALRTGAAFEPAVIATAYSSLLAAWKDYLAHDNHGRPIVFIGHSQGAAMLIRLLRSQVDPSSALRARVVSAIILGGNVQVPVGRTVGGSFSHIPTCASASQTRCVIAYSTFGSTPPTDAFFGRPGEGISVQSGQTAVQGQQVACVNPVTFSTQPATLEPAFPSAATELGSITVRTPWVSFPGLYTARCEHQDGATWLQVDANATPGDPRPTVSAVLGPSWGYHLEDVNLALGNLVADVAQEEAAFG